MAEDSDKEDRTESPSARKLEQAREDGNVPRSRELNTFAVTMAGLALLIATGGQLFAAMKESMIAWFTFNQESLRDPLVIMERLRQSVQDTLLQMAPLLGGLLLVAALTPLLIGGWNFTSKGFMPNFGKLNPLSGIKRLFSVNAATEGLKAVLKSALIGGVATWAIWNERDELMGLISMPLDGALLKLVALMERALAALTERVEAMKAIWARISRSISGPLHTAVELARAVARAAGVASRRWRATSSPVMSSRSSMASRRCGHSG